MTGGHQLQQTSYLGAVVESRAYDAAGRHAVSTSGNAAVTTNSYRLDNLLASRETSHAGSERLGTYSTSWANRYLSPFSGGPSKLDLSPFSKRGAGDRIWRDGRRLPAFSRV